MKLRRVNSVPTLWTVVALTATCLVEPSWGKWPFMRLNDLKLVKGDLFLTRHAKLMLALDDNTLVRMPWRQGFFETWTALVKITLPVEDDIRNRAYGISAPKKYNYDRDRAVALANLLLGRLLPFAYYTCNQNNWMEYICYGKTHSHFLNYRCPLNRNLNNVDVAERTFYFKNGIGDIVLIDDFPKTSAIYYPVATTARVISRTKEPCP